jgi:hypothetical protein
MGLIAGERLSAEVVSLAEAGKCIGRRHGGHFLT